MAADLARGPLLLGGGIDGVDDSPRVFTSSTQPAAISRAACLRVAAIISGCVSSTSVARLFNRSASMDRSTGSVKITKVVFRRVKDKSAARISATAHGSHGKRTSNMQAKKQVKPRVCPLT